MTIDWVHFTPWLSLAGGVLIGLAAALLLVTNGRIAGISGILAGVHEPQSDQNDRGWRVAFLLGLLCPAAVVTLLGYSGNLGPVLALETPRDWAVLAAAGLLVGIGTRLANGCTSGHGVCGLARLSPRSLVAVLSFMGAGMATVWIMRHLLGLGGIIP